MEHEKLIETADRLDNVIAKIKRNSSNSYIWYSVKGKNGCLFELGGRNINKLDLKAYIPSREDDKYVVYDNGFTKSEYAIVEWGELQFPSFTVKMNKLFGIDKMIKFLKNTDFKTYYPKIKTQQVIKEYETIYTM